jgi:metal-responsive CopG/Arc/MetJ family transcriptional regulator
MPSLYGLAMAGSTPSVIPGYTFGVKTAISVPDPLFWRVEHHAQRLNVSRSEFFARAAARFVDELDDERLTEAIDAALAEADSDSDSNGDFLAQAARLTLGDEHSDR